LAVIDERDQSGPDRDASDEVVGPVDWVDDPASWAVAGRLELLTLDRIPRAGAFELVANDLLGRLVGVADQGQIGFGLDHEIVGTEARHRDPFHGIGKHVREAQVIVIGRHVATLAALGSNSANATAWQRLRAGGRRASWAHPYPIRSFPWMVRPRSYSIDMSRSSRILFWLLLSMEYRQLAGALRS